MYDLSLTVMPHESQQWVLLKQWRLFEWRILGPQDKHPQAPSHSCTCDPSVFCLFSWELQKFILGVNKQKHIYIYVIEWLNDILKITQVEVDVHKTIHNLFLTNKNSQPFSPQMGPRLTCACDRKAAVRFAALGFGAVLGTFGLGTLAIAESWKRTSNVNEQRPN